jgi:hypothetical protein
MQWTIHGRTIYDSPWISLDLVDVEHPDGNRYEQHVVRMARPVAGTIMTDGDGRVLLMWRHRHITDTWGWEIPTGRIEQGKSPSRRPLIASTAHSYVDRHTGFAPAASPREAVSCSLRPVVNS